VFLYPWKKYIDMHLWFHLLVAVLVSQCDASKPKWPLPFRVIRMLSTGLFGTVYHVRDSDNDDFVLRTIRLTGDEANDSPFHHYANTRCKAEGPFILPCEYKLNREGHILIFTKYLRKGNIRDYCKLDTEEVFLILFDG
jgi:hypothetical protein